MLKVALSSSGHLREKGDVAAAEVLCVCLCGCWCACMFVCLLVCVLVCLFFVCVCFAFRIQGDVAVAEDVSSAFFSLFLCFDFFASTKSSSFLLLLLLLLRHPIIFFLFSSSSFFVFFLLFFFFFSSSSPSFLPSSFLLVHYRPSDGSLRSD